MQGIFGEREQPCPLNFGTSQYTSWNVFTKVCTRNWYFLLASLPPSLPPLLVPLTETHGGLPLTVESSQLRHQLGTVVASIVCYYCRQLYIERGREKSDRKKKQNSVFSNTLPNPANLKKRRQFSPSVFCIWGPVCYTNWQNHGLQFQKVWESVSLVWELWQSPPWPALPSQVSCLPPVEPREPSPFQRLLHNQTPEKRERSLILSICSLLVSHIIYLHV